MAARMNPSRWNCVGLAMFATVLIALGVPTTFAQTGSAPAVDTVYVPTIDLSFDVASVKPVLMDASHPFNPNHSGFHVHPAGVSYWFMTVGNLVVYAYGIDNIQFRGPPWTTVDPFDIEARFPEGAKKNDDRRMLQTLLKERFDLTFHIERKELESYVLVVGKHGEKLKASLPDPLDAKSEAPLTPGNSNAGEEQAKPQVTQNPDGSIIRKIGNKRIQTVIFDPATFSQHFDVSEMTMEELAKGLRICLGLGFGIYILDSRVLNWRGMMIGRRIPNDGNCRCL